MNGDIDQQALDAARRMAALSPETQAAFERSLTLCGTKREQVYWAFRAVGRAIGSKRKPVSDINLKRIFDMANILLDQKPRFIANCVATCMLDEIRRASLTGGFDFSGVDPYIGPKARWYLLERDDFHKTTTVGLSRR
jgi:hypothetical protein